jgi:predicted Ser/Thr protein kinase
MIGAAMNALTPTRPRTAPQPVTLHGYVVEAVLRHGDPHKSRVLLAHKDGQRVVIKDLSPMRPFFRTLFGRRMLRREARALDALRGHSGVPRLIERIGDDALAIEFFTAMYLRKSLANERKPRVLKAFAKAVTALHERGVVHLDLRQRKNILVTQDDRVILIDFESALVCGRGWFGRALTALFSPIDRSAVIKWQTRFVPMMLSQADRNREARWRFLKKLWFVKGAARRIRVLFQPR